MHSLANKIADLWEDAATKVITDGLVNRRQSEWTLEIHNLMSTFGNQLGFQVAPWRQDGAHQSAFLYDMMWYTLKDGYVTAQPMVMGSEWKCAPPQCVDDDFQKLVQARAAVRVWINNCANADHVAQQIENCKTQIRMFSGTLPDDWYVLVLFDWATRGTPKVIRLRAGDL